MIHTDYLNHPGALQSIQTVRQFLSDLRVFECLYNTAKEDQHFIYSWMQNLWISTTDKDPPWKLHEIADRLVANVKEALSSSIVDSTLFISTIKLSLKVAKFLYDASEFVHAFQASQAIFDSVHTFSVTFPSLERTTIRHEYEALCVMLQSMNVYSMYLEPEHRKILYMTAPQVLLRINRMGLSLAVDTRAEEKLLTSLPQGDVTAGLLRGLSSLSFSPGTMAKIAFHPAPGENSFNSGRRSAGRKGDEVESLSTNSSETISLDNGDKNSVLDSRKPLLNQKNNALNVDEVNHTLSKPFAPTTLDESNIGICTAFGLAELGNFYYSICNYRLAYQFAMLALEQICTEPCAPRVVVQVLRLACRICIIQRKYPLGMKIIQWLAKFSRRTLGSHNIVYANLLLDYGCLFLNTDNTARAVELYRLGLSMLLDCLPGLSMATSLALEDLAYAYYVQEYTSGKFTVALKCAEKAIEILKRLGHQFTMQCASASRVKALVLEEIAISDPDAEMMQSKLMIARDLHLFSLDLCERTFGVWNIQTAKHFGNLGRLFQSLEHNSTAEEMHLKAIMIKEHLLGPNDFEVGLSIGHLASLYNYHMNMFEKAEQLYLRSVQISLNLFGPGYSGLEYDYRGLQRVYRKMNNIEKMNEYTQIFEEWLEHRLQHNLPTFSGIHGNSEIDHYEPCPPEGTLLNHLSDEFRSEFEARLGEHSVTESNPETLEVIERTNSPTMDGEASRSTGL
ncbi:hypothetical protein Aperf_G00000020262 [Anoplocephala perfoliata]